MVIEIEKLISGGKGIAHKDGRTIILSGVLPGEIVDAEITKEKKNYSEGEVREILTPSSLRITPICPYIDKCGGCDFAFVSPSSSASLKEDIVKDIYSNFTFPYEETVYGSDKNYRVRARLHVDLKTKQQGFLSPFSSNLVSIKNCPVLDEKINKLLESENGELYKRARDLMFQNRVNRDTGLVEVPVFSGDEEVTISEKKVKITIGDYKYRVTSEVFFQSNPSLLPFLFSFVKENTNGSTIMDLYSGVGTFSSLFEGEGRDVYAVESNKKCLELSKINAPSAHSFSDDCEKWGKNKNIHADTIIVDPPRVGLGSGVCSLISKWKPERVIYVSCNPISSKRDISELKDYKITRAKVFDFYPGTSHIEACFILDRIF